MPWSLRWSIALRQTLDPGRGLSAFLSRVSIVGMALAIALLLAVQSGNAGTHFVSPASCASDQLR